jgi:TIR domain
MSGIYLSYRRMEAGGHAGRLVDYLSRHFGRGSVFRDIDTIRRGEDFAEAIESALNACDVVLVVIGNTWATSMGQDGRRRLDDPKDWVRLEVAAALRRAVLVIPVLVDGARLPEPASLPEELRPLCRRNACELSDLRWVFDVGELVKDLKKVVRPPPRLKLLRGKDKMLRWFAGSAIALVLLLVMILIGPAILKVHLPGPNSLISPTAIPIVSGPVSSQDKQPAPSPKDGDFRQETKAPDVVAELTRFVRTGNLVSAEVTLRNAGSLPAKFSCLDWRLIDEQTGRELRPDAEGGDVNPAFPATLASGETHVAWAKFKTEPGDMSDNRYSVNIESILKRPFEGLAPSPAAPPQTSQRETKAPGVVAELTRFVRTGNLVTAEVTLRNAGSLPAKFSCLDWRLIDEQDGPRIETQR